MFYLRYSDYILDMDEPALISHTVNAPAREWFTQGFSSYFLIYPEWTSPNSNFLRPVVQLVVYLCNLAFGENYKFYYLVYYLTAIAILFGLLRVLKLCSVSWLIQLVSGLLWALGPAFLGLGLVSIAFMFDLLAALICFAAFWACVQERYFVASLLLIGAVLTKETTLYAPLAAAATALFFNRADLRRGAAFAGLLVTPLALWAALRWNAFGTLLGGSTGLGDSQPIGPVTWVVGLATWPTGRSSLSGLAAAFHGDFAHPELLEGLAFLAINTFVWVTIALGARNASRRDPSDLEGRIYPAVWIWLLASLGFVILTGMSAPRYGSSTFIFLIIALALMTSDTRSRLAKVSGICALAGLAAR
jgi:hypothetical protein